MSIANPTSLREAIRAKCLTCCCGSPLEVRECLSASCPLHPYRLGKGRPKRTLALVMCKHCFELWRTCDGRLNDGLCAIHPFRGKRRELSPETRARFAENARRNLTQKTSTPEGVPATESPRPTPKVGFTLNAPETAHGVGPNMED